MNFKKLALYTLLTVTSVVSVASVEAWCGGCVTDVCCGSSFYSNRRVNRGYYRRGYSHRPFFTYRRATTSLVY